jgi:hypothetical protein
MVVSFACSEDALIVMSKLDEIDAVSLAVVCVDFLTTLEVVERY